MRNIYKFVKMFNMHETRLTGLNVIYIYVTESFNLNYVKKNELCYSRKFY